MKFCRRANAQNQAWRKKKLRKTAKKISDTIYSYAKIALRKVWLFVANFRMQKIHTYVKFACKSVRLHDCFVGFYRAKKYIKNFIFCIYKCPKSCYGSKKKRDVQHNDKHCNCWRRCKTGIGFKRIYLKVRQGTQRRAIQHCFFCQRRFLYRGVS